MQEYIIFKSNQILQHPVTLTENTQSYPITAFELILVTNLNQPIYMLEYYKIVLGKVRFDQILFRKELRKAFKNLVDDEATELKSWLKESSYV